MKSNVWTLFFTFSVFSFVGVTASADSVTCKLEIKAPSGMWTPWGRSNNNRSVEVKADLKLEDSGLKQTEIYSDKTIDQLFYKNIIVAGNLHKDPTTQKKKLFIGVYEAYGSVPQTTPSSLLQLVHLSKVKTYEGNDRYEVLLPIVSGSSDSGSVELLAEDYGASGSTSKLKLSCALEDKEQHVVTLNPSNKRELFSCDIEASHHSSGKSVKENNKTVILGYNPNEFMRDLQPIVEDRHFGSFFGGIRIMGNLFIDSQTSQPKFLLGIYRSWKFYNPQVHGEYWVPDQPTKKEPFFFAMPEAEIITSSDYAEVATATAYEGFTVKVACKKLRNRTQLVQNYSF